jgi:hypothetical protein
MSGDLNDYVVVNVSASAPAITQKSFKLPIIISHTAAWTERTREYKKAADVLVDFPDVATVHAPEYLAASALFAQNPSPSSVVIGRANDHQPTQQFEFTPAVHDSYAYKFNFDGHLVSFTSGVGTTAALITAGLKAALDALSLAVTTSQQSANTVLRVVANAAGAWHNVETLDRANLPVVQNHADGGVATSLAAIALERNDWYAITTYFNSDLYVQAVAAYAATNKKLYYAQSIDTVVPDTVKSGTDDIAEFIQNAANDYAKVVYSDAIADFLDIALYGARLAKQPGRATWEFTNLSNVPARTYSATERTNMRAKNVGWYEETAGVNIFNNSKLASGRFTDYRIYLDFFIANTQAKFFRVLVTNDKVPFTDGGIQSLAGCLKAQLKEDSSGPNAPVDPNSIVVASPSAADVSSTDRANRALNGVNYAFRYTGAVHSVDVEGVATL